MSLAEGNERVRMCIYVYMRVPERRTRKRGEKVKYQRVYVPGHKKQVTTSEVIDQDSRV